MFKTHSEGVLLSVHAQPGAKKTMVVGDHGCALKIKLHAPPVDGEANQALLAYVAEYFSLPKKNVSLLRGHTSRQKTLLLKGLTIEEAKSLLSKKLAGD